MKATGIVRRIDDLGRIVVPKEIRRTLRIREGDALEIFTDREGEIILKKYSPLGEMGNFADQYAESLAQTLGYLVCITDTDQVIAAAGPGKKEFQEQLITRQLAEVIARREQFLASSMDRKFTVIVSGQNAELKWQVVSPIICAGDAIGSVVILAKDGRKKPGSSVRPFGRHGQPQGRTRQDRRRRLRALRRYGRSLYRQPHLWR